MGLVGDTELVVGELRDDLRAEDTVVVEALGDWGGSTYLANTEEGVEVVLLRPGRTRRPGPG